MRYHSCGKDRLKVAHADAMIDRLKLLCSPHNQSVC